MDLCNWKVKQKHSLVMFATTDVLWYVYFMLCTYWELNALHIHNAEHLNCKGPALNCKKKHTENICINSAFPCTLAYCQKDCVTKDYHQSFRPGERYDIQWQLLCLCLLLLTIYLSRAKKVSKYHSWALLYSKLNDYCWTSASFLLFPSIHSRVAMQS